MVTVFEMIDKPPNELAEASPLVREVAEEAMEGGLADAVRIVDPEMIEVIVISSTLVVFWPIRVSRAAIIPSMLVKTADTLPPRVRVKAILVLFRHFHPNLVKPLMQEIQYLTTPEQVAQGV